MATPLRTFTEGRHRSSALRGSVSRILYHRAGPGGGDHLSGTAVARRLKRPTQRPGRAALRRRPKRPTPRLPTWSCSRWGLPSRPSHLGRWWSLTPPFHAYRQAPGLPAPCRRPALCCTCRQVTLPGRYPASCSVEFGLSSGGSLRPRSPDPLQGTMSLAPGPINVKWVDNGASAGYHNPRHAPSPRRRSRPGGLSHSTGCLGGGQE